MAGTSDATAVAAPKKTGSGTPAIQYPSVAMSPWASPLPTVPTRVDRPTRRNSATRAAVYSGRSGSVCCARRVTVSQFRRMKCIDSIAKKRASIAPAVVATTSSAMIAALSAARSASDFARAASSLGGNPKRLVSEPTAPKNAPAGPPGPSDDVHSRVRLVPPPRISSDQQPRQPPPEAPGQRHHRPRPPPRAPPRSGRTSGFRRSKTGCNVNPSSVPSRMPTPTGDDDPRDGRDRRDRGGLL